MTDQTSETTPDGLDVAAVRERVEAAGPGPWRAVEQTHGEWYGIQSEWHALGNIFHPADAALVAHARTDIPLLLAALDEARAEAARLDAALLTAVTDCDGYARLVEQQGWMERAHVAESARDAAEGVVREVRTLAEEWQADYDRIAATGRPPLAVLAQHADRVLATIDRLASVTTDATEGEA